MAHRAWTGLAARPFILGGMLVLASQSPRRREILAAAGFQFKVRIAPVPEFPEAGEAPADYVQRLARSKAEAIPLHEGEVALGADTVVVFEGRILEKPADAGDAKRMLEMLSGTEHEVLTGFCIRNADETTTGVESTMVRFIPLTPKEIETYVASGEPMDKAGAYGIQGLANKFVERVDGCYFNVMGLPVSRVYRQLKKFGVTPT